MKNKKCYVRLKTPAAVKAKTVKAEIERLIKSGKKTNEIHWIMEFNTTDKIVKEISDKFQVLKNRISFEVNSKLGSVKSNMSRKTIRASDANVNDIRKVNGMIYKFVAQYTNKEAAWTDCYATRRAGYKAIVTETKNGYNLYRY